VPTGGADVRARLGGEYLGSTGHMPYGQVAMDEADGPLAYALHAALAKPAAAALASVDATRCISGLAYAMILVGIVVIGWQRHSATMGALLAALYGLLPPVIAQLATAAVTVPGAIVIWA